jgi:hypothetical protein
MQNNSSKSSKSKNVFSKNVTITQCNGRVGMGCFDSSIWKGPIFGVLDWPYKTTIKWKFHISQKRKLSFPLENDILFPLPLKNLDFYFRCTKFLYVFIFSFHFCFFVKESESFRSTFVPRKEPLAKWPVTATAKEEYVQSPSCHLHQGGDRCPRGVTAILFESDDQGFPFVPRVGKTSC